MRSREAIDISKYENRPPIAVIISGKYSEEQLANMDVMADILLEKYSPRKPYEYEWWFFRVSATKAFVGVNSRHYSNSGRLVSTTFGGPHYLHLTEQSSWQAKIDEIFGPCDAWERMQEKEGRKLKT